MFVLHIVIIIFRKLFAFLFGNFLAFYSETFCKFIP